jgi:hypothetical protein
LLGKFTGLVLTLTVNTAAMAAGFSGLWFVKHSLVRGDTVVLVAVYFIFLKLTLVVALAMMFSCFTSPLLAILFLADCTWRALRGAIAQLNDADERAHAKVFLDTFLSAAKF